MFEVIDIVFVKSWLEVQSWTNLPQGILDGISFMLGSSEKFQHVFDDLS
jgi:hypothetical protein